ncbi:MAG: hypothetical protein KDK62_01860 [Chlamydiia bacterium]|nr:hypothetical protein [Chlamydiia bacterium]
MALRGIGGEIKTWAQEQWNTFGEKTGAKKAINSIKLAFSTLSSEERLQLDVQLKGKIHKIDLEDYFSLPNPVKDPNGEIFNHLISQLEGKSQEEIRALLPEASSSDIQKLKSLQKQRFLALINQKFPLGKGEMFLVKYPDFINVLSFKQELLR